MEEQAILLYSLKYKKQKSNLPKKLKVLACFFVQAVDGNGQVVYPEMIQGSIIEIDLILNLVIFNQVVH